MRGFGRGLLLAVILTTALVHPLWAAPLHWIPSWASAQQAVEPANKLPPAAANGSTLRQGVKLSLGGSTLRLVLSNAFGTSPLRLEGAHLALSAGQDRIVPASDRTLTFSGRREVTIPAGAVFVSDPVRLDVPALAEMAVTLLYPAMPENQTGHPGSRQTSYVMAGNHLGDGALAGAQTIDHWYTMAAIEVEAGARAAAVVALGDSITDGRGSTTNGNDRWTNVLAEKLAPRGLAVLNAGIGGNRLLEDGLGPNALARFDRDVLVEPGIKTVIVLEGINDLGVLTRDHLVSPKAHADLVAGMIAAYTQMALRAKSRGIKAFIGTITPYGGSDYYHPDAANEADRAALNRWIRSQDVFDGVIDFDAALRDLADPNRLSPAYDSGDHLHPSPEGYKVMGEVAAESLFAPKKRKAKSHKKEIP